MRTRLALLLVTALAGSAPAAFAQSGPPGATPPARPAVEESTGSNRTTTGAVRGGVYQDSDRTQVLRAFGDVTSTWNRWSLSGSLGVDVVSSASVDVRSSPGLSAVDVVSSASGRSTSGGKMTDTRVQGTGAAGWDDGDGHRATLTAAAANEADYHSLSGGANGSIDLFDRAVTLLGGLSVTGNLIESVLDPGLRETMVSAAWSAGVGLVLSPDDALRLRYDGNASDGYQASPYRNVRFGEWTTSVNADDQIIFDNTIGSADGLPETVPDRRISHAAVIEWVHALGDGIGLHPSARLGRDSWGIGSLTASIDLRLARPLWRAQLGYRFYRQSAASFYQSKYTMDPSFYTYYTADKELGRETGHIGSLDLSRVLMSPEDPGDGRLLLDGQLSVMRYQYPDFVLLDSRSGLFFGLGLTWER